MRNGPPRRGDTGLTSDIHVSRAAGKRYEKVLVAPTPSLPGALPYSRNSISMNRRRWWPLVLTPPICPSMTSIRGARAVSTRINTYVFDIAPL